MSDRLQAHIRWGDHPHLFSESLILEIFSHHEVLLDGRTGLPLFTGGEDRMNLLDE
jgi:hypothetical protein